MQELVVPLSMNNIFCPSFSIFSTFHFYFFISFIFIYKFINFMMNLYRIKVFLIN